MLGIDEPSDTDIDANLRDEVMSCTRLAVPFRSPHTL